jgi:uncharacterized protein with HEPN domain
MSNRDAKILLHVDKIERIEWFTASLSFEEFKKNDLVYYAVLRCLEIIGGAVKALPEDLKERYNEVEWRKIAGFRDVIIIENFANALPAMVLGDLAGSIVANVIGDER